MKIRRLILTMTALFLPAAPAFGQGGPALPAPTVTMLGAGASTCAKYLADLQSGGPAFQAVYSNWAMGYLTALNVIQSSKPGGRILTDASGIEFQLKNFCSANMGRSYADAVTNLANQFYR